MPSIVSHPAVPLAIGLGLGSRIIPPRLLACGMLASIIPDVDVVAFKLGIPYADAFGHRGASHSLLFGLLVGVIGAALFRLRKVPWQISLPFLFIATASHGVLDAFTTGGLGVAFLWPLTSERYFAPHQVIAVSPIGVSRFLSQRGLAVLFSELRWVWLPCGALAALLLAGRRLLGRASA